jgi:MoxR-like ATPase
MNHIILADEINRTSPKTQASLLEVMEEQHVTVEGKTTPVPQPFMVIATENPIEFSGTYQLPEAQLDRFLMRISMGYPEKCDEDDMLRRDLTGEKNAPVTPVLTREDVLMMQEETANVKVSESIRHFIIEIVRSTRQTHSLSLGASPRATLALTHAAQAWAYMKGMDYVVPEDVLAVVQPVLCHRLVLSLDASIQNATADGVLTECLKTVPVPPVSNK